MANGELDCVIAKSSLDLGIDWSSVNLIIQKKSKTYFLRQMDQKKVQEKNGL